MHPLDKDYLEARRTESLRMADESGDPCAAAVHREMATLYARRLAETGGVAQPEKVPVS